MVLADSHEIPRASCYSGKKAYFFAVLIRYEGTETNKNIAYAMLYYYQQKKHYRAITFFGTEFDCFTLVFLVKNNSLSQTKNHNYLPSTLVKLWSRCGDTKSSSLD